MPLICYEAIFPEQVRRSGSAEWLLNVTNDAWFGESSGPFQHLVQAQFRAIETGMPMVRIANTGITAIFDGYGRAIGELKLGTEGALEASCRPRPAGRRPLCPLGRLRFLLPALLATAAGHEPAIISLVLAEPSIAES